MLKDLKHSIKHSFIYSLGNLATKIVGFILIPIYTDSKYLSITDYGALSILEITSQLLVAILGMSLYQGYVRWYWDLKTVEERKKLFFSVIVFISVFSLIFSVILSIFSSYFSLLIFANNHYTYIFVLVIVNSSLLAIQSVPNGAMRIQSKSILFTSINLVKLFIVLLVTVYFVVVLKRGVAGIFEAQLLGSIFYLILSSRYIYLNSIAIFQVKIIRELIVYSYPLILASMSGVLLGTIDRYSLNYLSDLTDVGVYSLGFKFANTIKIFIVSSVLMALTPLMLKKINAPNNKRFYTKVLTYFSFGLMIVILSFSMFSTELVKTFTIEDQYLKAIKIIPVISFMIFFGAIKDTVMIGLHVKKKTKIMGSIIAIMACINLGLNILFIPLWGIMGAAVSTLISQFAFFITIYYFAQKSYFIPYEILKIFKIIIVAGVLYGISLVSNNWSWYYAIPFKLFLIATYPFLLYSLNFYEPVEVENIRGIWKKWKKIKMIQKNIKELM